MLKTLAEIPSETVDILKDNLPNTDGVTSGNLTTVLYWVYAAAGIVAVGIIVYAGTKYLLSQGQPDKTKQASQIIAFAAIGLLVVMVAAALTAFISNAVGGATE